MTSRAEAVPVAVDHAMEGCQRCPYGRGHEKGRAKGRLSQDVGSGHGGEGSLLDAVDAGGKKPIRALGDEALILASGREASAVVVGKALCGKGLFQRRLGGASSAAA